MNENSSATFIVYFHKYVRFAATDFKLLLRSLNDPGTEFQDKETSTDRQIRSLNLNETSRRLLSGLVDYSSSDDNDEGTNTTVEYSKCIEDVMSCLIRLHLKLDRLKSKELLPDNLSSLSDLLELLEEKYES